MFDKLVSQIFDKCVKLIISLTLSQHLLIALIIRLVLIALSEVQDKLLDLKYTDIDYEIFSDGAKFVCEGQSPFLRQTYRYTPLLAILMVPNIYCFSQFGKLLFSVLDVTSGSIIYLILINLVGSQRAKICAAIWLYNPLTAIISTRGSAESVVTTLVLLTVLFVIKQRLVIAGLIYGFVVHFKLYPIIYGLSFYLSLTESEKWWKAFAPNRNKFQFFVSALIGFVLPTYWSYARYGNEYIEEGWTYHFHRKDPQHNFSPYFYTFHFTSDEQIHKLLAYCAFIPQALFVLLISLNYCISRKHKLQDLMFAMFAQTAAFVTLNKVITSQYFLWYFCILPLIWPYLQLSLKEAFYILTLWLLSQAQWLLPAYLYEFQNWNCLLWVWSASCIFVIINLAILVFITSRYYADNKKRN